MFRNGKAVLSRHGALVATTGAIVMSGAFGLPAISIAADPLTMSLDVSSDTGASSVDGVTRDNTPTVRGTAPAKAKIEVRDGSRKVAQVTASTSGVWNITSASLADGPHSLVAHVLAPTPLQSAPVTITVDTVKPAVPTIGVSGPVVRASNGSIITDDSTPTLIGRAEAGTAVEVGEGSTVMGTVTAAPDGAWTFTTPVLTERKFRFTARATDRAGNTSYSAPSIAVTVTSQPIGAPTIALAPTSDTGASGTDGVTRDATPTVTGTAAPRARVELLVDNRAVTSVVASTSGQWDRTLPTLRDGARTLQARVGSAMSATVDILVDTRKPDVPTIRLVGGADIGAPTLAGTTSAGAFVSVRQGSSVIGTVSANGDGDWTFTTPPLPAGKHKFAAFATDLAGNKSSTAPSIKVVIEENAARPVTIDLLASSDTSRSDDNVTRDRTPTLAGTAQPSSTVNVKDGATTIGTASANGDGEWTFTTAELAAGTHQLTASAAGRTSQDLDVKVEIIPAVVDLGALAAEQGSRFDGAMAGGSTGFSLSKAGDVNADGYQDIVIGARLEDGFLGAAYLVFGKANGWPASVDLASLGSEGVRMTGTYGGSFSWSVADLGDVNGDRIDDIAITEINSGLIYVVFGRSTFPQTLSLANLGGSNDGAILNWGTWGQSVAGAGDVNNDGIQDIVVSSASIAGASIVFGRTDLSSREVWNTLDGSDGFRFTGIPQLRYEFRMLDGLGDVNGDGIDDVAIGSSGLGANGPESGALFVVFGRQGSFPEEFSAGQSPSDYGFRILGPAAGSLFGTTVAGAGDIDGDGLSDILASAPGQYSAFLVYGQSDGYGGTLDLADQAGQAIRLEGQFGHPAFVTAGVGDADKDGLDDFVVSQLDRNEGRGTAFLLFGRDLRRFGDLDLLGLDGIEGYRVEGASQYTYAGYSLSGMPDSNGDGRDELLLGVPYANPLSRPDAGSVFLVYAPEGD